MILYNGASGSLGQYFGAALERRGLAAAALAARIEDRASARAELARLLGGLPAGEPVTLVAMAALVSVPACERDPALAERTNVTDLVATMTDFVAAAGGRDAAVVYASTAHVYASSSVPLDEDAPLGPRSVYARTKLAGERSLAALGVPLTVARVFGLIAPRQPAHYVLPAMIARVRRGQLDQVPGLDHRRDYLDARDVCRLLAGLCQRRQTGVFNVCSGVGVTIRRLIEEVLRATDPEGWQARARTLGEAPARPDDVPAIVGNPARLRAALGEAMQEIPLAATVADALQAQ
jgi:nucleoside-diphosphate-sugar epimerase